MQKVCPLRLSRSTVNGPLSVSPPCHLKALARWAVVWGCICKGRAESTQSLHAMFSLLGSWFAFTQGRWPLGLYRNPVGKLFVAKRLLQPCQNLFSPAHLCWSEFHVNIQAKILFWLFLCIETAWEHPLLVWKLQPGSTVENWILGVLQGPSASLFRICGQLCTRRKSTLAHVTLTASVPYLARTQRAKKNGNKNTERRLLV